MKSLFISLGLLLLTACFCSTKPSGVQICTAPGTCCFKFKMTTIPLKLVSSITKTHSTCTRKGFIVRTVKGKEICYKQTFPWAQELYQRYKTESSR